MIILVEVEKAYDKIQHLFFWQTVLVSPNHEDNSTGKESGNNKTSHSVSALKERALWFVYCIITNAYDSAQHTKGTH